MLNVTSTPSHSKANPWLLPGIVLLTATIFLLDCLVPRGYAVWILYLIPLKLTYLIPLKLTARVRPPRAPPVVAAVCTVLVVFGFFLAPPGISLQPAVFNRAVGVGVLWFMAALLVRRKRAEEALRASERRLREVMDGLGPQTFVGLMTLEGTVIEANRPALVAAGLQPEDVLGKRVEETYWFAYSAEVQQQIRQAVERAAGGEGSRFDVQIRVGENQFIILDFSLQPLRNPEGKVLLLVPSANVITERKRAEEALRESEERLRSLFEQASDGIFVISADNRFLEANAAGCALMGYAREELLQMSVADVLAPHERPRLNTEPALMMSGQPHLAEWLHQRKDGSTWPAEVSARRLGEGQYLAMIRDLTERKQAEEALRESEARLRMSVQLAQEAERLRIARELHDELGQLLTGLKMEMSGIAHKLRRDQAALHEPVAAALDLLDSSIVSVRKIATELRPGLLDALGLAAAIEWQVEEFQARTGVSCSLTLPREKLALPDDQATALFRILQEALTNIARHAQAKHAEVRLAVTNGSLVLEVRDDGRGIRPEERVKARSLGIVGMRERALLLGGEVAVTGRPGGGTTVRASVPLEPPAAARKPA